MDMTAVKKLRRTLTLHFAVIACLTAMLLATGSESIFMPVFIFFVSSAAFVFVDTLEWFELKRISSAVGMLVATAISMVTYFYHAFTMPSESGQLLAIAGLLIYPQAVLFFQKKSLRVYEQLAVFLLLEMIVAALVNDNILFGVLLAPIMLLWVSALFMFSRYATMVQIEPGVEHVQPTFAEVVFRRFLKSVIRPVKKVEVVACRATLNDVQVSRTLRRVLQSVPMGLGAIAFAAFFFYLLPRTAPVGVEPSIGFQARVGLPKSLSIGTVGRLLSDPTPVMRVSLKDLDGKPYALDESPYLRARVMDTYGGASRAPWLSYGEWVFSGISEYRILRDYSSTFQEASTNRDLVSVEFDIKRRYAATMLCIPPVFSSGPEPKISLGYDRLNMVMEELDVAKLPAGKSLVYQIGSLGFAGKKQLRVMPAKIGASTFAESRNLYNLSLDFSSFRAANAYRVDLLAKAGIDESQPFSVANAIEEHLLSEHFSYTLDLQPPSDSGVDPIEDFLINQKSGHCQYFASAMVMMLRQSGIASRIVVGYHPMEFNRLGQYFPVKQNDAHAWVEALFAREDLQGTDLEQWLDASPMVWVRFDPTPGSEGGGLIEQRGQAMDYAEKLWKDYVVEGQKLANDSALYDPVSETSKDMYERMVERLNKLRRNLESGNFFSGPGGIGFAWQLPLVIISLGFLLVLGWHFVLVLPRLAPQLARRLGILRSGSEVQQVFYSRCLTLLAQHGLNRQSDETPWEFTERAGRELVQTQPLADQQLKISLKFLTNTYYRLRFSRASGLSVSQETSINEALRQLESTMPK